MSFTGNFIGITESVVINMLMTFVEVAGLLIVLVIGIVHISRGDADFGVLTHIDTSGDYGSPALAVLTITNDDPQPVPAIVSGRVVGPDGRPLRTW